MGTQTIITPLKLEFTGLATHRYRQFDAEVPGHYTREDLENPVLWAFLAPKLNPRDEIRVTADDGSFVATLYVQFVKGSTVKVKLLDGTELDSVDKTLTEAEGDYFIKMRGVKKWSIVKRDTGEIIEEMIPDQASAMKALQDLEKALAA